MTFLRAIEITLKKSCSQHGKSESLAIFHLEPFPGVRGKGVLGCMPHLNTKHVCGLPYRLKGGEIFFLLLVASC